MAEDKEQRMNKGLEGMLYVCINEHQYHAQAGTHTVLVPEGAVFFFRHSDPGVPDARLFAPLTSVTANDSVRHVAHPKRPWYENEKEEIW
jgi:hypothetical protein